MTSAALHGLLLCPYQKLHFSAVMLCLTSDLPVRGFGLSLRTSLHHTDTKFK